MTDFTIQDEFMSEISDLINENDIKILNKSLDIFDIVSIFLENNQSEDPFLVVNLGDVIRQFKKWEYYLPRITPFYAVKCNNDELILKLLSHLGCGFDCASKNEIGKVIGMGVDPAKIIYANPCKMVSQIRFARAHDCDLLVFDSEHELYKIKLYHSEAKLLLRIKTDDKDSVCKFSCKFGAELDEVEGLLKIAKNLDLNVTGIAFHVGSNCMNSESYKNAIRDSKKAFDIGTTLDLKMNMLDIGGGFPGVDSAQVNFEDIAKKINEGLDEFFSDISDLKVIAEPGRFFVASSNTLVVSVVNKKVKRCPVTNEKIITYFLNDGVYGTWSNIPMDHFSINESNLIPFNERNEKKYKCQIWGPTCDSIDKITESIQLPNLEIGQNLICINMGSYSQATFPGTVGFNGFNTATSKYILN